MSSRKNALLSEFTTTKIGGLSDSFYQPSTTDEFIDSIQDAQSANSPIFFLGAGSNTIFSDSIEFSVINNCSNSIKASEHNDCVSLLCDSGVIWNDLAIQCVESNLQGAETLIGIPGTVGGAAVQNIGAYGSSIGDYIVKVVAYDCLEKKVVEFSHDELMYSYRTSVFKTSKNVIHPSENANNNGYKDNLFLNNTLNCRYAILQVEFCLKKSDTSVITQKQVASILEKEIGERETLKNIADAVVAIRSKKGMLDYRIYTDYKADSDFYSTGSFFKNPFVEREVLKKLPSEMPYFEPDDLSNTSSNAGKVKIPAAWLIEHSGLEKGFTLDGRAALSSKHTLAIVNKNQASFEDMKRLAAHVQKEVKNAYGITLLPEAIIIE